MDCRSKIWNRHEFTQIVQLWKLWKSSQKSWFQLFSWKITCLWTPGFNGLAKTTAQWDEKQLRLGIWCTYISGLTALYEMSDQDNINPGYFSPAATALKPQQIPMFLHISARFGGAPVISTNIRTVGFCVKTAIILQRKKCMCPRFLLHGRMSEWLNLTAFLGTTDSEVHISLYILIIIFPHIDNTQSAVHS